MTNNKTLKTLFLGYACVAVQSPPKLDNNTVEHRLNDKTLTKDMLRISEQARMMVSNNPLEHIQALEQKHRKAIELDYKWFVLDLPNLRMISKVKEFKIVSSDKWIDILRDDLVSWQKTSRSNLLALETQTRSDIERAGLLELQYGLNAIESFFSFLRIEVPSDSGILNINNFDGSDSDKPLDSKIYSHLDIIRKAHRDYYHASPENKSKVDELRQINKRLALNEAVKAEAAKLEAEAAAKAAKLEAEAAAKAEAKAKLEAEARKILQEISQKILLGELIPDQKTISAYPEIKQAWEQRQKAKAAEAEAKAEQLLKNIHQSDAPATRVVSNPAEEFDMLDDHFTTING